MKKYNTLDEYEVEYAAYWTCDACEGQYDRCTDTNFNVDRHWVHEKLICSNCIDDYHNKAIVTVQPNDADAEFLAQHSVTKENTK